MDENTVQVGEVEETSPLASAPFAKIDPYDDMDAVIEGDEGVELPEEQPELAGKSKEDLFNELKNLQGQLDQAKQANDPVKALGNSFQEILRRQAQPAQQPMMPSQPTETPEQRRQRLQNLYLEDPIKANEEIQREQLRPVIDLMINNQVQLSKDLSLADPGQKNIYDRWSEEVEREVSTMSPVEKAQNPRVYQTAINRVRARHTDDVVNDLVEQAVAKKLAELGIDTNKPSGAKPSGYVPPRASGPAPTNVANRKQIVIPKWVAQEADKIGLDPKFYYQHLKDQGKVK